MMIVKHSEIFNPVKIESGISSFEKILNSLSGNWLLLTSKGNTKRGFTERYMDISKKFINLTVYDEIKPNPEIEDLSCIQTKRCRNGHTIEKSDAIPLR